MSILIDPAFVAIVPLGGRHVQHFWRLLGGLKIPYATLLDLDLGREGGGFGRVKTALIRLLEVGVPREQLLLLSDGSVMDQSQLGAMHKRQTAADLADMKAWVDRLSDFGVFFSTPLDVDLMMLRAFPAAYAALEPPGGGPRTSPAKAAEAVLGTAGPGLTVHPASSAYPPLLPAYCYHFLTRSKPATHLEALAHIDLVDLEARAPRRLKTVLRYIQSKLSGV
jgi:putative ATP-dependent endonuclease of OLD family